MTDPQNTGIPGMNAMTDPLSFVKNMWGSMGIPGMSVPGISLPTVSVDELDKKINDLKAVEAWLSLNMSMLRNTIQAMEIQRSTLASLQSLSAGMNAAIASGTEAAREASQAAASAASATADTSAAVFNTQMINPATWWSALQEQFGQAVSNAMQADPAKQDSAPKADAAGGQQAAAQPQAAKPKAAKRRSPPKAS